MGLLVFVVVLPWVIVTIGCWLGYELVRQNGRMLIRLEAMEERLDRLAAGGGPNRSIDPSQALPMAPPAPQGLPRGSEAPDFQLPDLEDRQVQLTGFRGKRVLFVAWDPNCGFCRSMAPEIASLPINGTDGRPIPVLVSTRGADQNRQMAREFGLRCPILLQEALEVTSRYQATGTPTGYIIDEQGRIASDLAVGAQALLALSGSNVPSQDTVVEVAEKNGHRNSRGSRSLETSRLVRNGLPAGTQAPDFQLPRVDGGELSLAEFRGRQVLLVFSDPNCGPCAALAPELETLHRNAHDLAIVMVSRGDREANRLKVVQDGLTFPVVLQRQWEISRDYGMFATPVAYLIDERGIIAADVATGAEAILALANQAVLMPGKV